MANVTAMNIIPNPGVGVSVYNVNGHKVPAINGLAYVLNADVVTAQGFGWTVANPQPSILTSDFIRMSMPAGMGPDSTVYAGTGVTTSSALPDGTTLMSLVDPKNGTNILFGSSPAGSVSQFSGKSHNDKDVVFNIPVQWAEWLRLGNGWRNSLAINHC